MNAYSIPRPGLPVAAYVLAGMVLIGLVGLGIAAFAAFDYIGRPLQALAFALIIEAGMISEALAITRKNWLAIPGLAISLVVSGIYNFTQAQHAGAQLTPPLTSTLQLTALSIGPLSAVFFLALATGYELRVHETRVAGWTHDRQRWLDDQETRRLQADQAARLAQIAADAREKARADRAESRRIARATHAGSAGTVQVAYQTGATALRGTYADFEAVQRSRNGAGPLDYQELMRRFKVSRRTAYNWLERYGQEHPHLIPEVN